MSDERSSCPRFGAPLVVGTGVLPRVRTAATRSRAARASADGAAGASAPDRGPCSDRVCRRGGRDRCRLRRHERRARVDGDGRERHGPHARGAAAEPACRLARRSRSGWTIVLVSIPKARGRDEAVAVAQQARSRGLPRVGVLDSSQFASLQPGYWMTFAGRYQSEAGATGSLRRARAAVKGARVSASSPDLRLGVVVGDNDSDRACNTTRDRVDSPTDRRRPPPEALAKANDGRRRIRMEANLAQLQSCMYQYSRAIYRSIKDQIDPYVDHPTQRGVQACRAVRVRGDDVAPGARSPVLRPSRPDALPRHPPVLPDHRAGARRLGGEAGRHRCGRIHRGATGGRPPRRGISRCKATTRKGQACQRTPLPGRDYCPSHQHLERTTLPRGRRGLSVLGRAHAGPRRRARRSMSTTSRRR